MQFRSNFGLLCSIGVSEQVSFTACEEIPGASAWHCDHPTLHLNLRPPTAKISTILIVPLQRLLILILWLCEFQITYLQSAVSALWFYFCLHISCICLFSFQCATKFIVPQQRESGIFLVYHSHYKLVKYDKLLLQSYYVPNLTLRMLQCWQFVQNFCQPYGYRDIYLKKKPFTLLFFNSYWAE